MDIGNQPVHTAAHVVVENKNNIFEVNILNVHNMRKPRLAAGCDHAGFEVKDAIVKMLRENGHEVKDFGTFSEDSVDYPDFAHAVANSLELEEADLGVLVCGSANGVAITANKHHHIRAAIAWRNDVAALARQHNNANVICIPARFVTAAEACQFVQTFLDSSFEGGRHQKRVQKIEIEG
jgi:ribose 5-phosphate isomerase B